MLRISFLPPRPNDCDKLPPPEATYNSTRDFEAAVSFIAWFGVPFAACP
jgi:hypothetical protein